MRRTLPIAVTLLVLLAAASAPARVIYVDNRLGNDTNDGTQRRITGLQNGPVRTLRRAQVLLQPGDVIEIANTGEPYYDALRLVGGRVSGTATHPTIINGNGAVLDGSDAIDPDAWEPLGGGLWRLEPLQKGWFQLVRGQAPVPEVAAPYDGAQPRPPIGQWAAWHGAIYYQALQDEIPANEPFRIASREAGVFLYGVRNVVVRDLRLRHFRLDGVNAHDLVDRVVLQNITSEHNGRSGVFVGGSSKIAIRGGSTRANRQASLLLKEKATADVQDVRLDTQPVVVH